MKAFVDDGEECASCDAPFGSGLLAFLRAIDWGIFAFGAALLITGVRIVLAVV